MHRRPGRPWRRALQEGSIVWPNRVSVRLGRRLPVLLNSEHGKRGRGERAEALPSASALRPAVPWSDLMTWHALNGRELNCVL